MAVSTWRTRWGMSTSLLSVSIHSEVGCPGLAHRSHRVPGWARPVKQIAYSDALIFDHSRFPDHAACRRYAESYLTHAAPEYSRLTRTIVIMYDISSGTSPLNLVERTATKDEKHLNHVNISVTWRGRRAGGAVDDSSVGGAAQTSGRSSAISTKERFKILLASLAGIGGRLSPIETPTEGAGGVTASLVSGLKSAGVVWVDSVSGGLETPGTVGRCRIAPVEGSSPSELPVGNDEGRGEVRGLVPSSLSLGHLPSKRTLTYCQASRGHYWGFILPCQA